mmetsp:Transcript_18049/g.36959  ORF Transcript_18049/g.36959 Transcript_18049/m.36959 type:complete len:147 (-) Transcript_18049:263-703(-)
MNRLHLNPPNTGRSRGMAFAPRINHEEGQRPPENGGHLHHHPDERVSRENGRRSEHQGRGIIGGSPPGAGVVRLHLVSLAEADEHVQRHERVEVEFSDEEEGRDEAPDFEVFVDVVPEVDEFEGGDDAKVGGAGGEEGEAEPVAGD